MRGAARGPGGPVQPVSNPCATATVVLGCPYGSDNYRPRRRSSHMQWIKPEFEFVALCSEVTSYLYHR